MAAVSDLLFGFPHSTAYDFRFDKLLLRVGALIEGGDEPFVYRRKKGNVRTLLDEKDHPIDEGRLVSLLGGQTVESFQRMFSLDHRRLREGGQAILDAKDDVGQAIFAAGSGLVGVVRLAGTLEEEAKAIWTDRASANRSYYVAQKAYDEARARLKENQLKSAHWAEQKKALETVEANLEKLRGERSKVQASAQSLERRRRILMPIARRSHLQQELATLGDVPETPIDAEKVLDLAVASIAAADMTAELARTQREAAAEQLSALSFNSTVLNRKAPVSELRAQKGAVDKATFDIPNLRARGQAASQQLARLQKEMGWPTEPAAETQARLSLRPQVAELHELLEDKNGVDSAVEAALAEVAVQREEHKSLTKQLADLLPEADRQPLLGALRFVRSQGDLELNIRNATLKTQRSSAALQATFATLAPWKGDASTLAAITLPGDAEIAQLTNAIVKAESRLDEEQKALRSLQEERARRELDRDQLMRNEHAVSVEMLTTVREARDLTWVEIRLHLTGAALVPAPEEAANKFTAELIAADHVTDKRFEAAETSAALIGVEKDLERVGLTIAQVNTRIVDAQDELMRARAKWSTALSVVDSSLSPLAFDGWRIRRTRALEILEALRLEEAELAQFSAQTAKARSALLAVIPPTQMLDEDAPLAVLLNAAEKIETEANEERQRRAGLEAKASSAATALSRAEARLKQTRNASEQWSSRWVPAVQAARLDMQASVAIVRARLVLMEELRGTVDTILGFDKRIFDVSADIDAFGESVRIIAAECGLENLDRDPRVLLEDLERALDNATTLSERSAGLRAQIEDATVREQTAQHEKAAAEGLLTPLLKVAGVPHHDQLAPILRRVAEARAKRTQVEELTDAIIQSGDGFNLEFLLQEADGCDAATLAAESEELQIQADRVTAEIENLAEQRQAAHIRFKQADDRPDAAVAAADLAQARAEMEARAEEYIRKRAETELLRYTVERYQRERQAPLLRRASQIFAKLTLDHYSALIVDIESGKPRLSGILADAATICPVNGMSEGTVDQLYLSLRLAALEESISNGMKLPFLADDLFINYDNDRAAAGFRVLAELARKTQVLFFTHHEHLIDVARRALDPVHVTTCRIGDLVTDKAAPAVTSPEVQMAE
jgi:uncharacterized protein YhaN